MQQILTEKQQKVYDFIVEFINTNHYSPSIREIQSVCNYKSPCPVQSIMNILKEKEYLTWQQGQARTIQIIKPINYYSYEDCPVKLREYWEKDGFVYKISNITLDTNTKGLRVVWYVEGVSYVYQSSTPIEDFIKQFTKVNKT